MFEVVLSPSSSAFYAAAARSLALKPARCFRRLETEPRQGANVKRLKGEWSGYLLYRVGDRCVIYRVEDASSRVNVFVYHYLSSFQVRRGLPLQPRFLERAVESHATSPYRGRPSP